MLAIGQPVIVIGDSRAPIGSNATIRDIVPCDFGPEGLIPLYLLDPPTMLGDQEMYYQRRHLMPLENNNIDEEVQEKEPLCN